MLEWSKKVQAESQSAYETIAKSSKDEFVKYIFNLASPGYKPEEPTDLGKDKDVKTPLGEITHDLDSLLAQQRAKDTVRESASAGVTQRIPEKTNEKMPGRLFNAKVNLPSVIRNISAFPAVGKGCMRDTDHDYAAGARIDAALGHPGPGIAFSNPSSSRSGLRESVLWVF